MYYFGSLTKKFKTPEFPGKYFNFPGNPGAQKPGKSRKNGIPGGNPSFNTLSTDLLGSNYNINSNSNSDPDRQEVSIRIQIRIFLKISNGIFFRFELKFDFL